MVMSCGAAAPLPSMSGRLWRFSDTEDLQMGNFRVER